MQSRSGFSGVYPMVFALFDGRGRLAREPMRRQVEAIVRHKAHGIAILGMATEVNKLSTAERRTILDWVAEDTAGAIPLAVTVAETRPATFGPVCRGGRCSLPSIPAMRAESEMSLTAGISVAAASTWALPPNSRASRMAFSSFPAFVSATRSASGIDRP